MSEIPKSPVLTDYKEMNDEESRISYELLQDYKSARAEWFKDRVEYDKFYHNVQYSPEEVEEIKKRGQAPLVINITYAIVKQIISLSTSASPIWNVDPVGDADKDTAYLLRSLMDATWYNSKGNRKLSQIIKNMSAIGVGYGSVSPQMSSTFGLNYAHVPYTQVYIDPATSEFDYNDAEAQIVAKVIPISKAAELFGVTKDQIKDWKHSYRYVDSDDDQKRAAYQRYIQPVRGDTGVFVIQRNQLERKKVYIMEPASTEYNLPRKVYFQVDEHLLKLQKRGLVTIRESEQKVLAKYLTCGPHTARYYLPVTRYTMVPFINEFNDNPFPQGDIDFIYGIQRAINKFVLLSILNATLSNNMKIMAPDGSVDTDYWQTNFAVPGAILTYKWKPDMPKPEAINPVPLSAAFFDMPRVLIQIMEYITGIFGVMQGDPKGAPDTASGLISLQSYGGQKTKLLIRNMEESLQSLGDVAIQLLQNYAPYNQVASYYNGDQVQSIQFNTLLPDGDDSVRIENDLSTGEFKTRVNVVTNYGGERQIKAKVLSDLAAQTGTPMLLKPILKLLDIPEADEVVQQIDQLNEAQQNIEELKKQLERMEQVNTQLENQVLQKSQKVEASKFISELDKIRNKIEKEYGVKMANEFAQLKQTLQGNGVE
jgi:hypothetical protein